jgi:hypothetical protein
MRLLVLRTTLASENQEQRALVQWLNFHPILKNFFCKNNNEGKRTVSQGWNLKLMGLRAGVSDLFIYYPTKSYHGLFVEMKRNKKYTKSERLTDTWIMQEKFLENVKSVGYAGFICYGFEDAKKTIEKYLLS